MEGLSGIIVPLKNVIFSGFMTVFIYIKLIIKTILFFTQKMKQKVWRLTELNCIRLQATLGWGRWLRLGSGLWLGRAGLSSSGGRMMVGDNLLMNMITTPWSLKHTYRTHYQLSSKPVKRLQTLVSLQLWFTVNYSYFFLFWRKQNKKIKTDWALHTGFAKNTACSPLGTWYRVCGASSTA